MVGLQPAQKGQGLGLFLGGHGPLVGGQFFRHANADLVADRRAHIASAAARVFRAKGFHNATIRDVAIAAGLSQGSLYNYVRSKDDILYLVHQDLTAGYAADVEDAIAGIAEPRARLRAALAAFTHAMAERHADIALIYQETHALGDESRRAVLAQTNGFIQRFEQLIADARAATASAATAMAGGDAFLSYGQAAKAEELYQLALAKPGADTPRLLTRLGIAQADAGNYADAQATFGKVTGPRQPMAQLWQVYVAQKAKKGA